jgi:hypothetical protein
MININRELAVSKNLIIDGNEEKYNLLVRNYKYLLEYYINSRIDLSNYDNMIKNSDLSIGTNSKYKSINEYLNLDYIFLINNLFVEKLSNEDINEILNKFNKDNISNELITIIERTYKDVILDNYREDGYTDKIYKVCYGSIVPRNMVNNNSLVFKLIYGKNLIDVEGDQFIGLHKKQLMFLEDVINKLKEEVSNKLNIDCEVLLEKDIY